MYVRTTEDIATYARERRKELGWSQQRLAERVGVGRWWVIEFERGKATVELGLVLRTLRALDLNLLLEEEGGGKRANSDDEIDLDDVLAGTTTPEDESL